MKKEFSTDAKVGVFIIIALIIIAYITIDVSNLSITPGGTYTVYTVLENAEGITKKTPVQIAGIPVGVVSSIRLIENRRARLGLKIKDHVKVTDDMEIQVRSRGVLGDVYLELVPGEHGAPQIPEGGMITQAGRPGDYQDLFRNAAEITDDLKEITSALKTYTVSEQSRVGKILENMEQLTENLANFSSRNTHNMDAIISNLAALTTDLKTLSRNGGADLEVALERISEITEKIQKGEGTVGRLIDDEATIDKTNEVLDNLADITHTYFSMKTELGYHLEYLGRAGNTKSYVDIKLKPRPDKYFQFGVVYNSNPPGSTTHETETIVANGTTTVVDREKTSYNKIRFTAQLAKQFSDFTVRGGLIESTGGFGFDYSKGPVDLHFDTYDLGEGGPNLKASAQLNLTRSIYLLGGVDDIASRQRGADYFFGAGIRFTDEDINSLFGGAGLLLGR